MFGFKRIGNLLLLIWCSFEIQNESMEWSIFFIYLFTDQFELVSYQIRRNHWHSNEICYMSSRTKLMKSCNKNIVIENVSLFEEELSIKKTFLFLSDLEMDFRKWKWQNVMFVFTKTSFEEILAALFENQWCEMKVLEVFRISLLHLSTLEI